jgi:fibronectin-binding autotransporter adhesin
MKSRSGFVAALLLCPLCIRAQTTVSWDSFTTGNWSNSADWFGGVGPATGYIVTFQGLAGGTSNVDETVAIGDLETNYLLTVPLTITATGGNYISLQSGATISQGSASALNIYAPIEGSGGNLWLNGGTGVVTLNPGTGSNTYSGSTEVFGGGTLVDGEANSYSPNSVMYIGGTGGGTLVVNFNEAIGGLNDGGANGSVVISSGATLDLVGGYSGQFSGVISGAGNLEKDVTGTLTLLGANTYTGTTVINGAGGTVIELGNGGTTGSIASISVSGTGTLVVDRSNSYTYSGDLLGALQVVQQGTGTTTFSGNNTYTGATTINAGTLQAGSTSAFGNSAQTLDINGSGTLNLNGFSIAIDSVQSLSATSAIALNGGATLTLGDTSASTTFAGAITGTGVLNTSSFSLNITGNSSTYSGGTVITSGTLIANNSGGWATGTGPITILPAGALLFGQSNTNGYIDASSAITDNGVVQFFRTDATPNVIANNIGGTGAVSQNGTGITELSGINTYSGTTTVFQGTLLAGSTSAFGGATGLSNVDFTYDGTLNLGTFSNTVGSISGGASGGTIDIGSGATLTIAANNGASPFMGTIAGAGSLSLTGVNAITTLSGANSYSGGTTIATGFLVADNPSGSATGTGAIAIDSGAILEIGHTDTNGSVAAANIADNGTIEFARTDNTSVSSSITGIGGISLLAPGTVTLNGDNSYSGATFIVGGNLTAGSNNAVGNGLSAVDIIAGGTLSLGSFDASVGSISGDSTSFINLGTGELTTGAANTDTTFAGVISGAGVFEIVGTGETILTGANTFTGGITIPGTGATLSIGDGATAGASIVSNVLNEGTLIFAPASSDNLTYGGVISGEGSVNFTGTGTISLSGANTYTGATTVASGTLADGAANSFSSASAMQVAGGANLAVNFNESVALLANDWGLGGGNVVVASGASLTSNGVNYVSDFQGAISGGGSFVVTGGVQGLAGNNTYSGGTLVTGGGELFVGSNTAVGTGVLTFDNGTELSPDANVTLANPIVLNGGESLDNDDGGNNNLTLTGIISEVGGSGSITWCTPGTLTLTNANTFTGGIDMREGVLLLGNDTAAGIGGTITLDTGTILAAYGGPGITRTLANDISLNGSSTQFGNLDDNNLVLNGTISGEANIDYNGGNSGTLTLNGASNGFSGAFTISSGTAIAGNNNSFGSSGNSVYLTGGAGLNVMSGVTVNNPLITSGSANVLSGSGTIGTPVTVDGTLVLSPSASPGGGPGNLTFTSGLTLASGGAIHFDIYDASGAAGTGYSLISANGGLGLTASADTLTFNIVSTNSSGGAAAAINFNSAITYSWTFATSPTSITGFTGNQFNVITSGFANSTNGGTFSVIDAGNDLTLNFTPVPEPSTWAMIAAGLLAVASFSRRRRLAAKA